jgi:hypothetical protein
MTRMFRAEADHRAASLLARRFIGTGIELIPVLLVIAAAVPASLAAARRSEAIADSSAAVARDAALTVVPAIVAGVVADGRLRSPISKARVGLAVADANGRSSMSIARLVVRNAIKWAPWQLGHIGVRLEIRAQSKEMTGEVAGKIALIGALLLGAAEVTVLLVSRGTRSLHDEIAQTRVESIASR